MWFVHHYIFHSFLNLQLNQIRFISSRIFSFFELNFLRNLLQSYHFKIICHLLAMNNSMKEYSFSSKICLKCCFILYFLIIIMILFKSIVYFPQKRKMYFYSFFIILLTLYYDNRYKQWVCLMIQLIFVMYLICFIYEAKYFFLFEPNFILFLLIFALSLCKN